MDQLKEVTTVSWFARVRESIKSVLVGLVLFVASFPLLWWNEGRAVQTAQSLEEGAGLVLSIAADKVDPRNEGKLVHVSGLAQTTDTVKDSDFGVEEQAIRLDRTVEMYQWVQKERTETKKKIGGGEEKTTTYEYVKEWSRTVHDSREFKRPEGHTNPPMKYQNRTVLAQNVTVGAFGLPPDMVDDIAGATPWVAASAAVDKLTPAIRDKTRVADGAFTFRPSATSREFDATDPQIGDHRIRFSWVKAAEVSAIAQQRGSSFAPFQTQAGDAISMLKMGRHGADEMFRSAVEANTTLTWILRAVGFLMMAIGIGLVLRPLAVLSSAVPLLGGLAGFGVFVLSVAIALPLSLLTIAVAWVAARPLLGIGLLAVVALLIAGLVVLLVRSRAKRKAAARS